MKRKRHCIYINENEQKLLNQKANELGLTKSAYIRELILNVDYIEQRANFEEFLKTNKLLLDNAQKIGNNINQIAHALNLKFRVSDDSVVKVANEVISVINDYKSFIYTHIKPKLLKKRKN